MHFDAMTLAIVEGMMLESIKPECPAELPIDARQQIKIKLRSDAIRIVIGGVEHIDRLDQIDPDHQRGTTPKNIPGISQESRRLLRLEIPAGGAGDKTRASRPRLAFFPTSG